MYIIYVYFLNMRSNFWIFTIPGRFDFPRHLQRFGQRCVPYLQCTPPHLQSRLVRHSVHRRDAECVMIDTPISHANHKSIYRYFFGEIVHPTFCSDATMPCASTGSCHALQWGFQWCSWYSGQHTFYVQPSNSIHLQVYKKNGNKSLLTCCLVHTRNMNMMSLTVA